MNKKTGATVLNLIGTSVEKEGMAQQREQSYNYHLKTQNALVKMITFGYLILLCFFRQVQIHAAFAAKQRTSGQKAGKPETYH